MKYRVVLVIFNWTDSWMMNMWENRFPGWPISKQTHLFRGPDWMKRVEQLQFLSQRQNKLSACGTIGVPIIQN
jgi:hypothetical protein